MLHLGRQLGGGLEYSSGNCFLAEGSGSGYLASWNLSPLALQNGNNFYHTECEDSFEKWLLSACDVSGTIIAVRSKGLGPTQTKVTSMRVLLYVELTFWWEETVNKETHSLSNDSKC